MNKRVFYTNCYIRYTLGYDVKLPNNLLLIISYLII